MTQEDLDVLAGFSAVWERVSGERIDSAPVPSVTWEDVLHGLHSHWQGCEALGRRACGQHKKRLMELAAEARRLFLMAQTEYFLETGDIFMTEVVCNFASYTPYNLRKSYKNAEKLAELLQKGAETCNVSVGDAGKTIAAHEKVLKELLGDCLR